MAEANSSVRGKFDRATSFRPPFGFMEFKSRMSTTREVMEALRNDDINIIGLYGMRGIGKTTMVKHVAMKAKKENLFDEIVMVEVGCNTADLSNIQGQIADILGLELEEESKLGRATQLRQRLANGKRFLLVLDDFWTKLDLETIGIPFGGKNKGCKVVLTSHSRLLDSEMAAKKNIRVKLLTEEEAWHLFKETIGDAVDAPDIQPIAKQVVNECEGLPLTLKVVGSMLKNKSNFVWTDALKLLRFASAIELQSDDEERMINMEFHACRRLKLLSDYCLEDKEAKSLLSLCCLYPVNCDIHIENLVRYGMGLRLFKDINGLGEARDRVRLLVDRLKNYHLLSNSDKDENDHVKMHNLVHDFGGYIPFTRGNFFFIHHDNREWPKHFRYEEYVSISVISDKITELPGWLICPKLRMLLLSCMNNSLKAPTNFFDGMRKLQVLNLELSIPLLPSSLQCLRNLHTLTMRLQNCKLENISAIGELLNLEILNFCAPSIKVLPKEIGRLANLMLLDLTGCHHLERISPGVISSLVRLQELYMIDCFSIWEADKREGEIGRRNAILRELQSVSNLKILEIYIPDATLLPKNPLFANMTKYKIRIGDNGWWSEFPFQKHLLWKIDKFIALHVGTSMLLKCTELLSLKGKGSRIVMHELVQDGVQHLKYLSIESCDTLICLVDTMDLSLDSSAAIFPILESLKLDDLCRLKEICCGQLPTGSFGKLRTLKFQILPSLTHFLVEDPTQTTVSLHNLRSIELDRCNNLGNLFSLSMAKGLVQLQELLISHCEMMEEVIWEAREEDGLTTNKIEFPRLECMALTQLEGLTSFSRGIDKIEFPQLKELHIKCLPKVKSFFPNESTLHSDEKCNATLQSIFPQQVAFPSLEELEIVGLPHVSDLWCNELSAGSFCKLRFLKVEDCHRLVKNVFPAHMLKMSPNLEKVEILNCDSVEEVFRFGGHQGIPIANIRTLIVRCCNSLRNLFSPSIARGLMHLRELTIDGCPMMEEVIWEGRGDGHASYKMEFPRLEYMALTELEGLTGFSRGIDKIEFPQLKELHIKCLPQVESFFPNESTLHSDENRNATLRSFFPQQVMFPSLEELELIDLPNVSDLWCSELSIESFCKLRSLKVKDCHGLVRNVVPAQILKMSPDLEIVEIYNCDSVEDVFGFECHQGNPLVNIRTLIVRCCGSLRNMFSPSIARCFVHLQKLIIYDCPEMEAVVANEDEEEKGGEMIYETLSSQFEDLELRNQLYKAVVKQEGGERIYVTLFPQLEHLERISATLFPQLEHLELRDLPSLRRFSHAIHDWKMQSLYHLEAINCPEMQTFSPGYVYAPKLHFVEAGQNSIMIKEELNKTIQHLFEKKQKKRIKNKKKKEKKKKKRQEVEEEREKE